MKSIAIIPARSGSKGLKDKNIKLLSGKPLIAYSIESALESGLFDKLVKMKYDIPNDKLEMFDEYTAEIDQKIGELLRA